MGEAEQGGGGGRELLVEAECELFDHLETSPDDTEPTLGSPGHCSLCATFEYIVRVKKSVCSVVSIHTHTLLQPNRPRSFH